MRLWTHTIGWWTAVFWVFGWVFTTNVPACRSCGWKIRVQRIGGVVVTFAVAILFMIYLWPHVEDFVARPIRKWVAMGLILLCLMPHFLWELLWPPAIDITAYKDSVDFGFRDADYAYDFADLNDDAEWVKIS